MHPGIESQWEDFVKLLLASGNPHLKEHLKKPLVQHLITMCVIRLVPHQTGAREENWQEKRPYLCMEHTILVNGCYFQGRDLPSKYHLGIPKLCYGNSIDALERYQKLHYVEGYAQAIIPIQHAWNLDKQGKIVELTLAEHQLRPLTGLEYFGIAFKTPYIQAEMKRRKLAAIKRGRKDYNPSLIDDWENSWPLLQDKKTLQEAIIPPGKISLFKD